jgi:hypothetical protein
LRNLLLCFQNLFQVQEFNAWNDLWKCENSYSFLTEFLFSLFFCVKYNINKTQGFRKEKKGLNWRRIQ